MAIGGSRRKGRKSRKDAEAQGKQVKDDEIFLWKKRFIDQVTLSNKLIFSTF